MQPVPGGKNRSLSLFSIAAAAGGMVCAADGFTIQFNYSFDTNNFFAPASVQRDRLEDAASFFEGIITDELEAISPGPGESWMALAENPSMEGFPILLNAFSTPPVPVVPANTIIVYVGATNLANNALGRAAPGGVLGISPFGGAWETTVQTRGDSSFGPWGGNLSMDIDSNWDYSLDGSTLDPGEYHFYSVLLHELGHVLGIGTQDSLTTSGHFAEGTTSVIYGTSTPQEAAMDPTLDSGTVKLFTDLDVTALESAGWQIAAAPVPEPGPALLAGLSALGLALRRRRG